MSLSPRLPAPLSLDQLRDEVARVLRHAIKYASEGDLDEFIPALNDELEHLGERRDRAATIVVIGETNAGKSSLVNALLERPRLSPVDTRVTTNAYIEFHWSEQPFAQVHLETGESQEITLEDVAKWATERGNPHNDLGVESVEVGLPTPLLKELTIIDSPGVGGLDSKHQELTMMAVGVADALLFVIDAKAPISAPALAFLEQAAERIDTVLIAVTKKDIKPNSGKVLDKDRELLEGHAPRFARAPMVLVSSKHLNDSLAAANADSAHARALRDASNVDEIGRLVHEQVAGRGTELSLLNAVQLCARILAEIERTATGLLEAVRAGPGYDDRLRAEREKLLTARAEASGLRQRLAVKLQLLASERIGEFNDTVRAISDDYGDRCKHLKSAEVETFFAGLVEQLALAALALRQQTDERLPVLTVEVLGEEGAFPGLWEARPAMSNPRTALKGDAPNLKPPEMTPSEISQYLLGAVAPRGLLLTLQSLGLGIAGGPAGIVTLLAGGVYVTLMRRQRVTSAHLVQLRIGVVDTVTRAQQRVGADYDREMLRLGDDLSDLVNRVIVREVSKIDDQIREHDKAQQEDERSRGRREADLESRCKLAHNSLATANGLAQQIRGVTESAVP
jgi:signal recognition particle receptor subunit beta